MFSAGYWMSSRRWQSNEMEITPACLAQSIITQFFGAAESEGNNFGLGEFGVGLNQVIAIHPSIHPTIDIHPALSPANGRCRSDHVDDLPGTQSLRCGGALRHQGGLFFIVIGPVAA